MRVQYELTLDEVAEAQLRVLHHTRAGRSWWRDDLVGGILLTGFFTGGLIYLLHSGIAVLDRTPLDRTPVHGVGVRAAVAVSAGILAACWFPFAARKQQKRRVRALFREQHGPGPFPGELELTPAGIVQREGKTEVTRAWMDVSSVEEMPGGLDIYLGRGTVLLAVPSRAFESEADRARFAAEVRRRMLEAREAAAGEWRGTDEGVASAPRLQRGPCCAEMANDAGRLLAERPAVRFCPWCGARLEGVATQDLKPGGAA
jgi:hypothetical protein